MFLIKRTDVESQGADILWNMIFVRSPMMASMCKWGAYAIWVTVTNCDWHILNSAFGENKIVRMYMLDISIL